MRILIASDIHGAERPASKIAEAAEKRDAELILLLGDLLYHGPRNDLPATYAPKRVIEILTGLKDRIIAVRGNCEAEVDQMVLPFPCMADSNTLIADGLKIFMTHGHIWNYDRHPWGIDVFMQGHTHIQHLAKKDGIIYLNPGSVSIPKGGNRPSYAFWNGKTIEIIDLDSEETIHSIDIC